MDHQSLRQLRKAKGLTQKELALRIGIAPSSICMYEKGDRNPSPQMAKRIAETLGFPNKWYQLIEIDDEYLVNGEPTQN